jgi:nitrile hydratase subunit beta
VTARFRPGDRVRTRAKNPEGHTRLPRYLCDRSGTIEVVHGIYPLPDERALGVELAKCKKEMLYTVLFEGGEVWRERTAEPLSISADLWDSYLEAEGST